MSIQHVDALTVITSATREEMGARAGKHAAHVIEQAIAKHGEARVLLASAPSQNETLAALVAAPIDWHRVTFFHMDEYLGLPETHPQSLRAYQHMHVLRFAHGATFYGLAGESDHPEKECARYGRLIAEAPIHLCCLGIGENGHLAFNDPHVADFDDPAIVKGVDLDLTCRHQQVHDGAFPSLAKVPERALTLTIPALMRSETIVCSVPGPLKAKAVRAALRGPIDASCPASVLRRHYSAILYLDAESAALAS